eukprot:TRINITY_DN8446_c0_g1_i4.p1 TRINITY_DN8446_c0_g1~~TRINITY_DN8446_c0_g1_i4.p1  ORF type:complete len:101 (+),score=15.20 TRINITY_DN8446_c0_g1_i4:227-529(+)
MKLLLSWILTQAKKPGRKSMAECFHRLKKAKAFTQRLMTGVHLNLPMKSKKKPEDITTELNSCLLYTSDAADDTPCVDLGGRRIIKKKITKNSDTLTTSK